LADVNYQQYAKDIAEEIVFRDIGPDDDESRVYDLAHEYADGSEHVIYYYKAHQFLEWLDARTIDHIEGEIEAGGSFVGYNDLASRIAFYALSDMISSEALTLLQNSES
tara:strand:- start:142 stop:468 length:327 start_codon:yes stop_codon:yes gene_type:complete